MKAMKVALCQMNSGNEVSANRKQAGELLDEAADGGADLAALPEVWTYMGSARRHREVAEPVPGPTSEWLADTARRRSMWILGGSILEAGDDGAVFNTSLLFDRTGELVARYRKIHLFDVDLPGQPPIRESFTYTPGEEVVTAQTEFGRVGLSICYDVRFPELYRPWSPGARRSCSSLRRSRPRPARTTGMSSSGPGPSRARPSSWPRPSGGRGGRRSRTAAASGTAWWSIPGAGSWPARPTGPA